MILFLNIPHRVCTDKQTDKPSVLLIAPIYQEKKRTPPYLWDQGNCHLSCTDTSLEDTSGTYLEF